MIIAQARLEGLSIVTHDKIFKKYDVSLLRV
jgi:PIN domain nuclease of toxin-antitoxin system